MTTTAMTSPSYATLSGIPNVDLPSNLNAALSAGRRAPAIVKEVLALRLGAGKLTPQEYFYYRLWEADVPMSDKQAFVGKIAQHAMHVAAGSREWFAASADKILFHSIMDGAGLRVPSLLAITQTNRRLPNVPTLAEAGALATFLRDPALYPLFAKQVAGKYSLSVVSADAFDPDSDEVVLLGGERRPIAELAASLPGGAGYLIQRQMASDANLAGRFGPRLWSVRLLVFVTPDGPLIHRAVAKIATGINPADNYWRTGNRLGAIDLASGTIGRVVAGTGTELRADALHPDTGTAITGAHIPGWEELTAQVKLAAMTFAGIRTQSWDVALSENGPVLWIGVEN